MRKFLAIFMILMLMLSMVACSDNSATNDNADESNTTDANDTDDTNGTTQDVAEKDPFANGFIVGSTFDINADMMSGWSHSGQNPAIKELIYGYSTFEKNEDIVFVLNETVVKNLEITENTDGSKTYTYEINDNLKWNNKEPITAKDFVFSVLFGASPERGQLDNSSNVEGSSYVGYDEFHEGLTKTFSGVRLLNDYTFSLTAKAEEFPNYFETVTMSVSPMPLARIAPGVEITDDGTGATLSDAYTVELLTETILDSENGYRYNPDVTCGAYNFESFDPETKQAVLVINPEYLGGFDGVKPSIEKIVFKKTVTATQLDELRAGTVHLLSSINGGDNINQGLDMVDEKLVSYVSYPRPGYGKLTFATEFGPTQFVAVRQAIAYSLDRVEFANLWTGGYGQLTHGYYGLSQWEAQESMEFLETELNHYSYNLDNAKQVLIDDGWTLNADGGEFVEGTDDIRHKMVDGELMALEIKWASTEDNPISEMLVQMLLPSAPEIGMKIDQTTMDYPTLQKHSYRLNPEDAIYHMFNSAVNFSDASYVWYYFSSNPEYFGIYNTSRIVDETLESVALQMKNVPAGDTEAWLALWQQLQDRFNELVVELPLYSDEYHTFFHPDLENFEPYARWDWNDAIIRANLAE